MKSIRIGVVGVGSMGMNHCRTLTLMKNCEFVGIYDPDKQKCQTASKLFQVPYFDSYEDLLKEVDAIIIAAPTSVHFVLAREALLQNKHVLVEKPLVTSIHEANELNEIAMDQKRIVQVGHIERFNPGFQQIEKLVNRKEIVTVDARRFGPALRTGDTDVVFDLMIHDIDIILYLVDSSVKSISAVGISLNVGSQIDAASALLTFQNGVIANLQSNRISQEKIRTLSITERNRFIKLDYISRDLYVFLTTDSKLLNAPDYPRDQLSEKVTVPYGEPLYLEIRYFLDSIAVNHAGKPGIPEAKAALEVALRIKEQIYTNTQR